MKYNGVAMPQIDILEHKVKTPVTRMGCVLKVIAGRGLIDPISNSTVYCQSYVYCLYSEGKILLGQNWNNFNVKYWFWTFYKG